MSQLEKMEFDEDKFVTLLGKLVGEAKFLQVCIHHRLFSTHLAYMQRRYGAAVRVRVFGTHVHSSFCLCCCCHCLLFCLCDVLPHAEQSP